MLKWLAGSELGIEIFWQKSIKVGSRMHIATRLIRDLMTAAAAIFPIIAFLGGGWPFPGAASTDSNSL